MDMSNFVTIGENIHCTLIVKLGGIHTVEMPSGGVGVKFNFQGQDRILPIPADWEKLSPAMAQEKVKHIALAIHHARNSSGDDQQAGVDYLINAAERQIAGGANFLDVNVDEYTNDDAERLATMTWMASFLSERFDTPLSIDSSNKDVLRAGLKCCRTDIGAAMVNSVSLERADCVELIPEFKAEVVVGATGKEDMPCGIDDRLANFRQIIGMLDAVGVPRENMHLDPLVFPISVDPSNGKNFLEATAAAKKEFGPVKLTGGYSNISFGMPQRKLLNMVFVHLAVQHGAGSGIINPVSMPASAIGAMDEASEKFKLAHAVLTGKDMYGMEFIAAHREGKLS